MALPTFRSNHIGKLQANRYLEPEPDSLFINLVVFLLYALAIGAFLLFIWAGQKYVQAENSLSILLGADPANLAELRVSGLMVGVPPGLLSATVLCSLALCIRLLYRIERHTRQQKELLFYLLTEGVSGPPR